MCVERRNYPSWRDSPTSLGRGGVVTGEFYPTDYRISAALSASISAVNEQRPCRGGLSGQLASAQDRN